MNLLFILPPRRLVAAAWAAAAAIMIFLSLVRWTRMVVESKPQLHDLSVFGQVDTHGGGDQVILNEICEVSTTTRDTENEWTVGK